MTEDYLTIIWKTQEWPREPVSTTEIASILSVTPSSVSANLKKLAREGLIDYEPYGRIDLTPVGREIALMVVRRHRILEAYLVERLGLSWDEVHVEADALEHAVSDLVLNRMDEVLGNPAFDPHGDAIPRADGTVERVDATRLTEAHPDSSVLVVRISDSEPAILRYLEARAISIGTRLRVESRDIEAGSLSVMRARPADGCEEPVEVGTGAARAVWVSVDPNR
jgi:DtxR family transcriptional regulator, Mn-dependent transcriptional regulator